jgi:hypothetical protein
VCASITSKRSIASRRATSAACGDLNSAEPIELLARRLNGGDSKSEGAGEVSVVVQLADQSAVEIKLPGRYAISPQWPAPCATGRRARVE